MRCNGGQCTRRFPQTISRSDTPEVNFTQYEASPSDAAVFWRPTSITRRRAAALIRMGTRLQCEVTAVWVAETIEHGGRMRRSNGLTWSLGLFPGHRRHSIR